MSVLGVAGAGTMGAGIAQLAALAGYETLVFDPDPAALEGALERIRAGLNKGAKRSRWSAEDAERAAERLRPSPSLRDLGPAEFVIEAAPEKLELKRAVFSELSEACGPGTVLATNTSSIPVTAIAAGLGKPGRVVGMHFFNPPPLMPLVEVIPGLDTEPDVVARAREVAERFGKKVIVARDLPGFMVNRCGRPLYGESLRLLAEQVGSVEQIDRICRNAGGFRMGPFELMDLVGIDVAFDVARSFHERSFGEPRWRPSPLQAQMVQSGHLGRKTGRGWHEYRDGASRPPDPEPPARIDASGRAITVIGAGNSAESLRSSARRGGFTVNDQAADAEVTFLADESRAVPKSFSGDLAVLCETRSLASWAAPGAVGLAMPALNDAPFVELSEADDRPAGNRVGAVLEAMGILVERVGDGPGLLLGRILVQIVNEGAFALGEGVGSAEEINLAAELGLNYPAGPLALGDQIGWPRVLARLDGIWSERREERYRPAPKLLELAKGDGRSD